MNPELLACARNCVRLVSVFMMATFGSLTFAQEAPDPQTLLRGVEAARLQVPPSSLTLKFSYANQSNSKSAVLNMDIPMRTVVSDRREKRILGYWNGDRIVDTFTNIPPTDEVRPSGNLLVFYSILLLTTAVFAVMIFRIKRQSYR